MIRVINFIFEGVDYPLFIEDTDSGINGKDILTKPGAYDEVASLGYNLPIVEMNGSIDGYTTKMFGLLALAKEGMEQRAQYEDCTANVTKVIAVPETAAKMIINQSPETEKEFLNTALEVIHHYESVTRDTKVFLPEEAFQFVDAEVAKKMRSTRQIFALKSIDNQEIIQASAESEYGIVLPAVQDLHGSQDTNPSALDILRVCAPCRQEVRPGVFKYDAIYHTPYYKVDARIRGHVPQHMGWQTGYAKNDLLGIQANEHHMYDNLYTFMLSDSAAYVSEICTGVLLNTHFGQKLKRFMSCKNQELLSELISDIDSSSIEGVECSISFTEAQDASSEGDTLDAFAHLVKNKLSVTVEAMCKIIDSNAVTNRIVDIERLPFVINFSDDEKEELTRCVHQHSILTNAMFTYVVQLCCKAYDINWGHTGATRAIPSLVSTENIPHINELMAAHLNAALGKTPVPNGMDLRPLYATQQITSDDDGSSFMFDAEDEGKQEELLMTFDYYITTATMQQVRYNALGADFFNGGVTGAETTEASIVEYWRKVNGETNLTYFLTTCFTATDGVEVLLQAFYKLMRWGDRKPSLLVFPDFPDIKTVFDLNTGKEIPNTAIVDENQLVKVNGCSHTLAGLLTSAEVSKGQDIIVGFLLCKDYGVKKYVIASWCDLGEMLARNEIDIAEFKGVEQVPLSGETAVDITTLQNSGYQLFTSSRNIETGLQLNIQPTQLSELALLMTPGIMGSAEYLRSKQAKMVVTTKDRQYQILSLYTNIVRSVWEQEKSVFQKPSISTIELGAIAQTIYNECLSGESKKAPEANAVRAQQAIVTMALDDGPTIQYDTTELKGKFTFINDLQSQSQFPEMQFSDQSVASIASRRDARFVLLLLETPEKYILCRKDIGSNEVLVTNNKISCRQYTAIQRHVDFLKQGTAVNVTTSNGPKPIYLHESLKEFI